MLGSAAGRAVLAVHHDNVQAGRRCEAASATLSVVIHEGETLQGTMACQAARLAVTAIEARMLRRGWLPQMHEGRPSDIRLPTSRGANAWAVRCLPACLCKLVLRHNQGYRRLDNCQSIVSTSVPVGHQGAATLP